MFVRFFNSGLRNRQRQIGDSFASLIRAGEQLDAIRTLLEVIANQCSSFIWPLDIRYADMVLQEEGADVDRFNRPNRFAGREDTRAVKLAVIDAAANCQSVVQYRGDIENGREAPAVEHPFELGVQLCIARLFRIYKRWREDVDVTVPEASRDREISAIDSCSAGGNADRSSRSENLNFPLMYENGAVCERRFIGRWIDLRADQGQIVPE